MTTDAKIVPLITDIEKIPIGNYLETSKFERLAARNGFGPIWQQFYKHAVDNRSVFMLDYDHKSGDCETALIHLIETSYQNNRDVLHKILYHILKGFIDWNYNEIELNEIFDDLEIIDFPSNLLDELKQRYLDKTRIILDHKKLTEVNDPINDEQKIKKSEVLDAKATEWIRLVSTSELDEVINQMLEYCSYENVNSLLFNELINLSSRLHRIQKKVREGTIDIDTENMEINKINVATIEMIDKIKSLR